MKIYYFILIMYGILLSGCGTKGSLYIPEEKYPQAKIEILLKMDITKNS